MHCNLRNEHLTMTLKIARANQVETRGVWVVIRMSVRLGEMDLIKRVSRDRSTRVPQSIDQGNGLHLNSSFDVIENRVELDREPGVPFSQGTERETVPGPHGRDHLLISGNSRNQGVCRVYLSVLAEQESDEPSSMDGT